MKKKGVICLGNVIRPATVGYVETLKDRLTYIVDFMYDNFDNLNEAKTCNLLCDLFISENFEVEKNISGVNNSFKASYGSGDTVIAYICEYDVKPLAANSCSHNFTAAMNVGAAIGLKRAINEIGGKVIALGCPGHSKLAMLAHGEFDDISAVICGHASTKTYESGTSLGSSSLELLFRVKKQCSCGAPNPLSSQYPGMMLFNLIESYKSINSGKINIFTTISSKYNSDSGLEEETDLKLVIKANEKYLLDKAKTDLIDFAKFSAKFYDCSIKITKSENNYLPLITHSELSKITCHNLKECGLINIYEPVTIDHGIDLGNVSHRIPTVNPGIAICKKHTVMTTPDFNKSAKSTYSKENMIKAASALALTGVDIIQNPEMINPIEKEA